MHLLRIAALFVVSSVLVSTGCRRGAVYEVTGVVRAELEGHRLVIEHDPIPDFMPAMTMAFQVTDPSQAIHLRAGDRVAFRFRLHPTGSYAEEIRFTGRAEAAPVGPALAPAVPRLRVGDPVPDLPLVDQRNQPLPERMWSGRYTLLTFLFTRCPVPEFCPALALRYGEIQERIRALPTGASTLRLLAITLDPEFDTPEVLSRYGEAVGADPAIWSFATGPAEEVTAISRAFAVYTERNGALLDHTLTTALVGPDGRIIEIWRGNQWKADEILAAFNTHLTSQP